MKDWFTIGLKLLTLVALIVSIVLRIIPLIIILSIAVFVDLFFIWKAYKEEVGR